MLCFDADLALSNLFQKYSLKPENYEKKISEAHLPEISSKLCENWRLLQPHFKVFVTDTFTTEKEKKRYFFQSWMKHYGSNASYLTLISDLLKAGIEEDAESICTLLLEEGVKVDVETRTQDLESSLRGKFLC